MYALSHNGYFLSFFSFLSYCMFLLTPQFRDTLSFSAWNLLGLLRDISRARTHFLAVTLRRTDSFNSRTMYSLVDAEALPWSVLDAVYANRAHIADLSPVSPRLMLEKDEEGRKRRGEALGSVMVVSIELPHGDNRSPRNALSEVRLFSFCQMCQI